jgi:hypothetical protein
VNWRSRDGGATTIFQTVPPFTAAKGLEANGDLTSTTVAAPGSAAALPADIANLLGISAGTPSARGVLTLGG